MTKETFDTLNGLLVGYKAINDNKDSDILATKHLMVHKRVGDEDLTKFVAKAFTTHVGSAVDNEIILMNENCICFKSDDKYYLLPAKVLSMSLSSDDNLVRAYCDYGEKPVVLDDFDEIGGAN